MITVRDTKDVWFHDSKNWRDFINLIANADQLIRQEQRRGKNKLRGTIAGIKSRDPFANYPVIFLPKRGEAIFIGDTHGDPDSTISVLEQERCAARIRSGEPLYIVFLGDYADRGKEDVRNLEIVLNLKCAFPSNVYLLRGNHEETNVGQSFGLLGSCIKRFGYDNGQYVFQRFNDLFERFSHVVVTANGIIGLHGGIPVDSFHSLLDLRNEEILTEVRWNDPSEEIDDYVYNYKRGTGYLFGKQAFRSFMKSIRASVLIRSHEYVTAGYKFMFNNAFLTIFSNGGSSSQSGYRDFILYPKYVKVDLSKPIKRWDMKHVYDIRYSR
ncbi:MAG: metallophosphoesterase [Patescibacteria group bacterium]|nr:metallophosphoesterase [Patescibacteria group bacterium]MDD5715282.1 metallophosphoesterase [Patescibacteria group bacterium]